MPKLIIKRESAPRAVWAHPLLWSGSFIAPTALLAALWGYHLGQAPTLSIHPEQLPPAVLHAPIAVPRPLPIASLPPVLTAATEALYVPSPPLDWRTQPGSDTHSLLAAPSFPSTAPLETEPSSLAPPALAHVPLTPATPESKPPRSQRSAKNNTSSPVKSGIAANKPVKYVNKKKPEVQQVEAERPAAPVRRLATRMRSPATQTLQADYRLLEQSLGLNPP